jgi:uncharacterized protein (DUF2141 family)
MKIKVQIFSAFCIMALILTGSCAKISSPAGGLRDKKPPVVLKSDPANKALNYKGKDVSITFDEYVVLDNINDKFLASPPMKRKPRVFTRGKNVIIAFDDKLKDSSTYTFYFQDAIRDLNEGNILNNYQFVFSTGNVIDTISVTGNVYNSFNLEAPAKTMVMLYRELADSAVKKHLPDYISKVKDDGYFRIDNVRPGIYKLYALKDADNSRTFNLNDEEFAFMNNAVSITPEKNYIPPVKDTVAVKKPAPKTAAKTTETGNKAELKDQVPVPISGEYPLMLFAHKKTAHYLTTSGRPVKYQLAYALSLPPDTMKFRFYIPDYGEDKYLLERSRNNDTLKVWLTDSTLYSQPAINTILTYPFTDTLGILGYKQDTITMRFTPPRVSRNQKVKRVPFSFDSNIKSGALKPGSPIVFNSTTPFRTPDTSRIRLYSLNGSKKERVPYLLQKDKSNICRYSMTAEITKEKKYLFIADSASFSNIFGECNDSIGIRFSQRDPETYNSVKLNIHNYNGSRIIQLLDSKEKILREEVQNKDGIVEFKFLDAGNYRLRVIYDLNNDGKWTTGDFTTGRQPEPVSYYPSELELKTGWNAEQDWDIGKMYYKEPKLREKKQTK